LRIRHGCPKRKLSAHVARAEPANCCFKLINFVFISNSSNSSSNNNNKKNNNNNNNNAGNENREKSFCFLILCFHLPLFLRYLPICAPLFHLKRFSRPTNYYLNFDMPCAGQQMGLFK